MSRTIEYKGKVFIWYFVEPLLALITLNIRLGILSISFWCWTEGFFPCVKDCVFEFRNCWVQSTSFINIYPHKFSIGLRSGEHAGWSRSLIFVRANTFLLLMHCRLQQYLAKKSILLHIDDALLLREIIHLASSHNLLQLFVDHLQIVVKFS